MSTSVVVFFICFGIFVIAVTYGAIKLIKLVRKLIDRRDDAVSAQLKDISTTRATVELLPRLQGFLETTKQGFLTYDQHRYDPDDAIMAFLKIEKGLEDLNPDLLKISKEEKAIALKALEHFSL